MVFEWFPYSSFGDLNLDWIMRKVKEAVDKSDYAKNYVDNLDFQSAVDAKIDEMRDNGELASILAGIVATRINIATMIDEPLTGANLELAITRALQSSKYLYIPAGTYKTHIQITGETLDILAAPDAVFESDLSAGSAEQSVFTFDNCSVHWHGGKATAYDAGSPLTMHGGGAHAILEFYHCTDCVVEFLSAYDSCKGAVIGIDGCTGVEVRFCSFDNILMAGVHILMSCVNVRVTMCRFTRIKNPTGYYYSYAVYTGEYSVTSPAAAWMPPRGLEYSYNYVEDCEDSGLDTHGASNVSIAYNTVINAATAITAYNDARRSTRPEGWVMENVELVGNYCITNRNNTAHGVPFIFVFYSHAGDGYNEARKIRNVRIINNTIICNVAPSYSGNYSPCPIQAGNNVEFVGNTVDGGGYYAYALYIRGADNVTVRNNLLKGASGTNTACRAIHCNGIFEDNSSDGALVYGEATSSYCYMRGSHFYWTSAAPRMVEYGDIYDNGGLYYVTTFGQRVRPGAYSIADNTGTISTVGRVSTVVCDNPIAFIAGQVVVIGTVNCRVQECLDQYTFTIYSSNPPADGSYTIKAAEAESKRLGGESFPVSMPAGTSVNDLIEGGTYYRAGAFADVPTAAASASHSYLIVIKWYGTRPGRQILMTDTASRFYWRQITTSGFGNWFTYASES